MKPTHFTIGTLFLALLLFQACVDNNGLPKFTDEENQEYLEENAAKEDVVITESGLHYEVLEEGEGDLTPGPESIVTFQLIGTLINGQMVADAVDPPGQAQISDFVDGLKEGVQLMRIESRFRFVVPPELAYGDNPPGHIPENAILVYEVRLLEIDEQAPPTE